MKEPDARLPAPEQEERRRCFWSVYLLDKLVSCGRDRHPALLDDCCAVRLPCHQATFHAGFHGATATLHQLLDWNEDLNALSGNFSLAILAGSILGRCTRMITFHDREVDDLPPWDLGSEYVSLNSALLLLESRLQISTQPISDVINATRCQDGTVNHQVAGHGIFAHTVFHLSYCLLNHPFLLRIQLRKLKIKAPSRFLYLAFQRSCDHARNLVKVLRDAEEAGGHLGASFYAYATCVAGGILLLNQHAELHNQAARYSELMSATQMAIDILEKLGSFWDHASKMVCFNGLQYSIWLAMTDSEVFFSTIDFSTSTLRLTPLPRY